MQSRQWALAALLLAALAIAVPFIHDSGSTSPSPAAGVAVAAN